MNHLRGCRGFLATCLLLATLLAAFPASATSVDLGLGADYWRPGDTAEFNLTFTARTHMTEHFSVGGRFGALVTTGVTVVGAPIDLQLRATFARMYVDGLVGPWILFQHDPLHTHAAFGFGLHSESISVGVELGWLSPGAILGLRLGIQL